MLDNALYYPRLTFNNPTWLKAMALIYDSIYRIVPDSVTVTDDEEIKSLLEGDGKIGRRISPKSYIKETKIKFMKNKEDWSADAFQYDPNDEENFENIHEEKVDEEIRQLFMEIGGNYSNKYFEIPKEIGANYMLFLAQEIARKNSFSLITDEMAAWTSTTYMRLDGNYSYGLLSVEDLKGENNPLYLLGLVISSIVPINISDMPMKDIIKFRNKRKDEITQFRNMFNDLVNELHSYQDENIIYDRIKDKLIEYNTAYNNYIKCLKETARISVFKGTLLTGVPASPSLISLFIGNNPEFDFYKSIITLIGSLSFGFIFSLVDKNQKLKEISKNNPYSFFANLEKDFKKFNMRRGEGPITYAAYNYLEEFIND